MTVSKALKRQFPDKKSNFSLMCSTSSPRHLLNFLWLVMCLRILSIADSLSRSLYFYSKASFSAFSLASFFAYSCSSSSLRRFMLAAKFFRFSSCSSRDWSSSDLAISALIKNLSISRSDLCLYTLSRYIFYN